MKIVLTTFLLMTTFAFAGTLGKPGDSRDKGQPRHEKPEKPAKPERPEKPAKPERPEKLAKPEHPEQSQKHVQRDIKAVERIEQILAKTTDIEAIKLLEEAKLMIEKGEFSAGMALLSEAKELLGIEEDIEQDDET